MKKILLTTIVLVLSSFPMRAQLVWKTAFQVACEQTGVVYRVHQTDVGSIPFKRALTKGESSISFTLSTFIDDTSGEKISAFTMQVGNGLLVPNINLDCSEIELLVDAVGRIAYDKELRYISKTANLEIIGSETDGCVELLGPGKESAPGDFSFFFFGSVNADTLVKKLAEIKRKSIE